MAAAAPLELLSARAARRGCVADTFLKQKPHHRPRQWKETARTQQEPLKRSGVSVPTARCRTRCAPRLRPDRHGAQRWRPFSAETERTCSSQRTFASSVSMFVIMEEQRRFISPSRTQSDACILGVWEMLTAGDTLPLPC